jgi:hypothetical protein
MSETAIDYQPATHTTVHDHWWWRPGRRQGQYFYACHLTLDAQPGLRELVRGYQLATRELPFLPKPKPACEDFQHGVKAAPAGPLAPPARPAQPGSR